MLRLLFLMAVVITWWFFQQGKAGFIHKSRSGNKYVVVVLFALNRFTILFSVSLYLFYYCLTRGVHLKDN